MKIALIREEKDPPDSRVVFSPEQVASLRKKNYDICVQKSPNRCFEDNAYAALDIPLLDNVDHCDVLIGVKEVPLEKILPGKVYFMFSHTLKEQPYNQNLFKKIMAQHATLIDYEALTNEHGARVIAFGKFAGMVGAHNALYTYGKRLGTFSIPRMNSIDSYEDMKSIYKNTEFPPVKLVLTGTGRVSNGSALVLKDMGFTKVTPLSFVKDEFEGPVFTQLSSFYYAKRKDGEVFDSIQDFYDNPSDYESDFHYFLPIADIMINGIYWYPKAPKFFTLDQMNHSNFNLKVIADVTCDIAPESSIPSTIRASTIADPIFGFDPKTEKESDPGRDGIIDMMTIDNLPNELPKDASIAFGNMFIEHVLPHLDNLDNPFMQRATMIDKGKLGKNFGYLKDYAN